jgi:hypothetical protein
MDFSIPFSGYIFTMYQHVYEDLSFPLCVNTKFWCIRPLPNGYLKDSLQGELYVLILGL